MTNFRPAGSLADEVAAYMARCMTTDRGCIVRSERSKEYGRLRYSGGTMRVHRASHLVHNGPIGEGMEVRHRCDNPPCVNPEHLLVGTHADNMRDAAERQRVRRGLSSPQATVPPEVIREAVAEYLRGGRSQESIASQHGVSVSTFSRWVRGAARPDAGLSPVSIGRNNNLGRRLRPCGTPAARMRHVAAGEPICEPCRVAYNAYCMANRKRLAAASA